MERSHSHDQMAAQTKTTIVPVTSSKSSDAINRNIRRDVIDELKADTKTKESHTPSGTASPVTSPSPPRAEVEETSPAGGDDANTVRLDMLLTVMNRIQAKLFVSAVVAVAKKC